MTVTTLRSITKTAAAPAPKQKSAAMRKRLTRQRHASYGVGSVALVLTGLSLSHLAGGVQLLTQSDASHAWAMAAGIDLGFIGLELSTLCAATEGLRKTLCKLTRPAVIATLVLSALMNAYAFAANSPSLPFVVASALLGISIPALIYVLTKVSVTMWTDAQK